MDPTLLSFRLTGSIAVILLLAFDVVTSDRGASMTAPRINPQPEGSYEMAYKLGEDVRMTCSANDDANPTYSWQKNGVPFNLSAPNIVRLQDDGSFTIKNPQHDDEGVYQCFASNAFGTAVARKTLLRKAVLEPFPTITDVQVHRPTVGTYLVLQCRPPRSYPTGNIYWGISRPGSNQLKAIDNNDRVVLSYEGHLYISNVLPVDARDGDPYVCIANNRILGAHVQGHNQRIDPAEVPGAGAPPDAAPFVLWTSPTRDVAIRGQTKKMKCIFAGLPTPNVTWTREGSTAARFTVTREGFGTEIEINNVDFDDAGTYKCSAENRAGGPVYRNINLVVESPPYWRQNKPPGDVEAVDEDNVEIDCLADGRPRPNITWSINGQNINELPEDPRRRLDGNKLRIESVNQSDAAVLQCIAANEHGSILANAILSVAASPPSFTKTPNDTKVVVGRSVILPCSVYGAPKPVVSWHRGTPSKLVDGDRFIQQETNLEIMDASLEDVDIYHCHATNKFGSERASCSLIVRTPTTILRPSVLEKEVNETEDVRIPCRVQTDEAEIQNLAVEWLKDRVKIDFRQNPHLSVDTRDHSLLIKGSRVKDTARYSCRASNGLDNATSEETRVTVNGRPDPPRDVILVSCTTDAAELTWTPAVDNNSPILEYIVYATDSSSKDPTEQVEVARISSRRALIRTNPWATYVFTVVARNALGVSDPAEFSADGGRLVCVTPESAPRRNPRGVCSRLERPRQLKIVWEPVPRKEQNGAGFHYRVGYRLLSGGGTVSTSNVNDPTSSELVIHNQDIFQKYEIFVQSVNRIGEAPIMTGERKIGYSGEGKPLDAPQSLRLRPYTLNSTYAEFAWDPVDPSVDRVRGFFRGYRIQYWRAESPRDIRSSDIITGPPPKLCQPTESAGAPVRRRRHHHHRHSRAAAASSRSSSPVVGAAPDLWPYSKIRAGVLVLNQGSEGALSDTIEFTTPEGVPDIVASLNVIESGSNHLTVRWATPIFPNGVLLSYILEYQVALPNVGSLVRIVVTNPLQTTKRLLDLEPKTDYQIWVMATTSVGVGGSVSVYGTTLEVSDPDAPSIGHIDVGDDSANVTWLPSASDPATNPGGKFYVEYINAKDAESEAPWNRSDPTPDAAGAGENWVKIANLTPGEQYYFRVVAVNGIEPDTRETRSDPPWKERIGPPIGTSDPIAAGQEEKIHESHASAGWFIILMCIIVFLLLLLLIACLIQRSRGQMYPVYEKEKAWGHDPNAPEDAPFGEYTRNNEPSDAGQGSLDSDDKPVESDLDSLGEYEDQDPSKFNEDGSFIGQYNRRNQAAGARPAPSAAPGYNTFV